jgi:sulfur relay protein TusB/DsrH
MLHLIFQSPIDYSLLLRIESADDIVFYEKAIFTINKSGVLMDKLQNMLDNNIHMYVLREDLDIRGIDIVELVPGIVAIDYFGLLELTEKNKVIRAWN